MTRAIRRIPWAKPEFLGNERAYVLDALESTWISGGPYVDRFEAAFAKFAGCRYGIATANGTTALHLALVALGIGPGDEVIVPTFTFVAPANVVVQAGAAPVFVDCDPQTWCMDPRRVQETVTKRTKAIIPVHLYGYPCDMKAINAVAERRGLAVIEDAAQAHGTTCYGRPVGSFGIAGCFSFHAAKTLTMGEGGIIVTRDKCLAGRLRMLRDHGMRPGKRYWHDLIGYNYRLTNYQAALGCAQLEQADRLMARRRRIAEAYRRGLAGMPGLSWQQAPPWADPVPWTQAIVVDPDVFGLDRDRLAASLERLGIETRPTFYPAHTLPIHDAPGRFAHAERIGANGISLPAFSGLSDAQIRGICQAIRKARASRERLRCAS